MTIWYNTADQAFRIQRALFRQEPLAVSCLHGPASAECPANNPSAEWLDEGTASQFSQLLATAAVGGENPEVRASHFSHCIDGRERILPLAVGTPSEPPRGTPDRSRTS